MTLENALWLLAFVLAALYLLNGEVFPLAFACIIGTWHSLLRRINE